MSMTFEEFSESMKQVFAKAAADAERLNAYCDELSYQVAKLRKRIEKIEHQAANPGTEKRSKFRAALRKGPKHGK